MEVDETTKLIILSMEKVTHHRSVVSVLLVKHPPPLPRSILMVFASNLDMIILGKLS